MAVATAGRSADSDEHDIGFGNSRRKLGCEGEAACLDVGFDQRIEAWLENRDDALPQRLDLLFCLVDADHLVTEIGKTCPRHKPDITRANHDDAHKAAFLSNHANRSIRLFADRSMTPQPAT
ncbi:hypothetical protein D3C71_847070 [compost metagenome]